MIASYWLHLAPAMLILAVGFGLGVIALTQAAVYDVDQDKPGIASALLNAAQQLGVALGLAALAGVAATITAQPKYSDDSQATALVAGYSTALTVAAGILLCAAAVGSPYCVHARPSRPRRRCPPRPPSDPTTVRPHLAGQR